MADHDFILIDTAGRSPRDAVKLKELRAFLEAARPDEVHLVLSTVCGTPSLKLALERFSGVRADRLIFTKLDEAAEVGVVLNVVGQTKLPLSYLTNGQDVPNDIDVASAAKLAMMVTEPHSVDSGRVPSVETAGTVKAARCKSDEQLPHGLRQAVPTRQ